MINPFDYLFYKIYNAWSYLSSTGKPINYFAPIGILFLLNAWTTYMLLVDGFSKAFAYGSVAFVGIFLFIRFRPKREAKIIAKYSKESNKSRMIGNTVVIFYVTLSIVSFILVMKHYAKG